MKYILQSAALIFLSLVLSVCDSQNTTGAGSPAESGPDTPKIGEQISESGIIDLADGADTDEDAERHVAIEEKTLIADTALEKEPRDNSKKEDNEEEVNASAEKDTDNESDTEKKAPPKKGTEKNKKDGSEPPSEEEVSKEGHEAIDDEGTDIALAMDTTAGNWYITPEKHLFTKNTETAARSRIDALRRQIHAVRKKVIAGALSRNEGSDRAADLRKEIAAERNLIGSGGVLQRGIHTYRADESLELTVNPAEAGWYKIVVVAKNLGPLPGGYDSFSMTLLDKTSETVAGNFAIRAREKAYSRGRLTFQINEPGERLLDLLWNNDARDEKGDADIQIKDISLKKIKEPRFTLRPVRRGNEYSYLDGRWFFEKQNARTCQANQTIGYTFYDLIDGTYELTIKTKNNSQTGLPADYEGFRIEINSENNSDEIIIPASDKKWTTGRVALLFSEGDATVYLTWLNDTFSKGKYDTNLTIQMVSLKRIADSNMSAYLMKTTTGNRVLIMGILMSLVFIISGASLISRKKALNNEKKT